MRTFTKSLVQFWTDDQGLELRAAGEGVQLLALYLMSSKHSNYIQMYRLPLYYAAADLGTDVATIEQRLMTLEELGFARYDRQAEVIWVIDGAATQLGDTLKAADKMCKAVQREFDELPAKCAMLDAFIEKYGKAYHMSPRSAKRAAAKPAAAKPAAKPAAEPAAPPPPPPVQAHTAPEPEQIVVAQTEPRDWKVFEEAANSKKLLKMPVNDALDYFMHVRRHCAAHPVLSEDQLAERVLEATMTHDEESIAYALQQAICAHDYDCNKLDEHLDSSSI